ncbi:hypothetical protein [Moorena producens]|uniref:hypothetical protein n=1 Tax=Moorena producens TaxID=1155739 RepID=UPI003C72054E
MATHAIARCCYLYLALPTLHQCSRFVINSSGGQCLLILSPDAVISIWHCPPYINISQYSSSVSCSLFPVPFAMAYIQQ